MSQKSASRATSRQQTNRGNRASRAAQSASEKAEKDSAVGDWWTGQGSNLRQTDECWPAAIGLSCHFAYAPIFSTRRLTEPMNARAARLRNWRQGNSAPQSSHSGAVDDQSSMAVLAENFSSRTEAHLAANGVLLSVE